MNFINAQFSVKFPQQVAIRRYINEIEDVLKEHYDAPQAFPIPDNFAADAPRMLFTSKGNHSQIVISQIAIDLNVNFDENYAADFDKIKNYIKNKVEITSKILGQAKIDKYYFCGLMCSYTDEIDTDNPIDFMQRAVGELGKTSGDNLYDASWHKTYLENDFYINERMAIGRKLDGVGDMSSDLFNLVDSKIVDEKIITSIDINNKARYMKDGLPVSSAALNDQAMTILRKMEKVIIGD